MVSMRDLFAESLGVDPREIEKRQAEESAAPSIGESISHGLGQVFDREENRLQKLLRHELQAEGPVIPKAPATPSTARGGPDLQR
ncbi:hypothetical protein O4157_14845 [Gordonia amicalis]|uniref:hypothetical protein n=1 Tax=Gordonia amicalis TaxID=89053 RepID=UPI0022B5910A|nr:hypothetical protein [Gordonia amicalis]MCZ4652702.1 hypothetical protein [Gordonia amicalis]